MPAVSSSLVCNTGKTRVTKFAATANDVDRYRYIQYAAGEQRATKKMRIVRSAVVRTACRTRVRLFHSPYRTIYTHLSPHSPQPPATSIPCPGNIYIYIYILARLCATHSTSIHTVAAHSAPQIHPLATRTPRGVAIRERTYICMYLLGHVFAIRTVGSRAMEWTTDCMARYKI